MAGDFKKLFLYSSAVIGWIGGTVYIGSHFTFAINPEAIQNFLGEAASNQITQAGFFFSMAAWIHSGRVKKEIKSNFVGLTEAINNVADSLREDLKNHSNKLDNLDSRVKNLEKAT